MDDGPDHTPEAVEPDETFSEPPPSETQRFEPTGHDDVDHALGALEGIDERAIHEHVAIFEGAHAALRRALDRADP